MKIAVALFGVFSAQLAWSFVEPLEWGAKCVGSDAIVRGVVVEVVLLTKRVDDSRGASRETNVDETFTGPHAVAVVRVTDVLKGPSGQIPGIIFVPCGYDFDESPAELTESKDYILFLDHMGSNYFRPLDPFCVHRVRIDRVGMSGLDTEMDFEEEKRRSDTIPLNEFKAKVAAAIRSAADHAKERGNKPEKGETGQPASPSESGSEGGDEPHQESDGRSR